MQLLTEVDIQLACDRLLETDERIMYSSYLNGSGSIVGEAMKESITSYDELTIIVLPISPRKDSLVLAIMIGSDLAEIVTKTKTILASRHVAKNRDLIQQKISA